MRALGFLAIVCALLAACGGRDPPFRWRDGATVTAEFRVREELLPARLAREVRISTRGVVRNGSEIALDILSVGHESIRAGATVSAVDTETSGAVASERSSSDAAIARVAERLLGRTVVLTFDGEDGLRSVVGLDAALAAAAGDPDAAAARDGLAPLVGDAPILRSLRAAGLSAPPENFRDKAAAVELRADVYVPGRGVVVCRFLGDVGADTDGSPIVRWNGRVRGDADAKGPPGDAPPEDVGDVLLARIEGQAETQYDAVRATPLRGNATVRMPFARGATIVTTTSFVLAVGP